MKGSLICSIRKQIGDPTMSYIVLFLAIIFEGAALYFALNSFNKLRGKTKNSGQPSEIAKTLLLSLLYLKTGQLCWDSWLRLEVFYLTSTTGNPVYDGVASITIGVILSFIALLLAYESKNLLIGESAMPEVIQGIADIVAADNSTSLANRPITMHLGAQEVLLLLDVEFKDELSSDQIEAAVKRIETKIKEDFPIVKRIFIEAKAVSKIAKA